MREKKSGFEWFNWIDGLECLGDIFSDEAGLILLAAVLVIWGVLWAISRLWQNMTG